MNSKPDKKWSRSDLIAVFAIFVTLVLGIPTLYYSISAAKSSDKNAEKLIKISGDILSNNKDQLKQSSPSFSISSEVVTFNDKLLSTLPTHTSELDEKNMLSNQEFPPDPITVDDLLPSQDIFEYSYKPPESLSLYACSAEIDDDLKNPNSEDLSDYIEAVPLCNLIQPNEELENFPVEIDSQQNLYASGIMLTVANNSTTRSSITGVGLRSSVYNTETDYSNFETPTRSVMSDYKCLDNKNRITDCDNPITIDGKNTKRIIIPMTNFAPDACDKSKIELIQFDILSFDKKLYYESDANVYDIKKVCD